MTSDGGEVTRRPDRRRRSGVLASLGVAVALLCVGTAATVSVRPLRRAAPAIVADPVVVIAAPPAAPLRLEGALVRGAARDWAVGREAPPPHRRAGAGAAHRVLSRGHDAAG